VKVAVIGAGLGGLASACMLAHKGHDVTVIEKNGSPGGKINQVQARGFRFDTGPSLLTMPSVLKKLFNHCDAALEDYLTLEPVEPICRYVYADSHVFNCYQNLDQTLKEISTLAPEDAEAYKRFLTYSENLFERTKDAFLFNPLYNFEDIKNLKMRDFLRIDAFKTVAQAVDNEFQSAYMQQFFKRFTTYNGSSPFQAPATLNVIPHVELSMGGYYLDGGIYTLVEALMTLAKKLGVIFKFETEVQSIITRSKQVEGVKTKNEEIKAECIISNGGATETYRNLLSKRDRSYFITKRMQHLEPSCSGLVLLLGINKKYEQLSHHNIFFSKNYKKEFDAIFNQKKMPDAPTIYIANTSATNPNHAPAGGSNLFVLINAPYLSKNWSWQDKAEPYSNFVINALEKRGLDGLRDSIIYQRRITPVDFYERYKSNKGSIYGTSSNSRMAAFVRPKNKVRDVDGLYMVGGSTHPGGGIPLVIQSAFNAVELIKRYE